MRSKGAFPRKCLRPRRFECNCASKAVANPNASQLGLLWTAAWFGRVGNFPPSGVVPGDKNSSEINSHGIMCQNLKDWVKEVDSMPGRTRGHEGYRRAEPAVAITALVLFLVLLLVRFWSELGAVYQWIINHTAF